MFLYSILCGFGFLFIFFVKLQDMSSSYMVVASPAKGLRQWRLWPWGLEV
jgi:hypothetical protein